MEKLQLLIDEANKNFDGHFAIVKFTTNWKVGFDTPNELYFSKVPSFPTLDEAIDFALENRPSFFDNLTPDEYDLMNGIFDMEKDKEEWATYSLSITCPEGHVFLADVDTLYRDDLAYYKGYPRSTTSVYCQKCNKTYRID